jgi:uncharacterized protein
MIIDLKNVTTEPRRFEFILNEDFRACEDPNDESFVLDSPLRVRMELYKAGHRYVLDGFLEGRMRLMCDRCLMPYHLDLVNHFRLFLSLPPAMLGKGELELLEEDMEVSFITGQQLDVDEIIREQIYLSLPMKKVCGEHCLGLCPLCGANLNEEACHCLREPAHPGFSKLLKLSL